MSLVLSDILLTYYSMPKFPKMGLYLITQEASRYNNFFSDCLHSWTIHLPFLDLAALEDQSWSCLEGLDLHANHRISSGLVIVVTTTVETSTSYLDKEGMIDNEGGENGQGHLKFDQVGV